MSVENSSSRESMSPNNLEYENFEDKLKDIKIQDLQKPHPICIDQCNIFQTIKNSEYSGYWGFKKVPHSQLDLLEAIKLLRNRLGIERNLKNRRQFALKKYDPHIKLEELQILQKAVKNLRNNNYSIQMLSQLLSQPINIVKYLLKHPILDNNFQVHFQIQHRHVKWIRDFIKSQNSCSDLTSIRQIYYAFKYQFTQESESLSLSMFRKLIKKFLNIKYKKPILQSVYFDHFQLHSEQKQYFLTLMSLKKIYINIIYLDETIINNRLKQRRYWFFTGRRINKQSLKIRKNISVLGAMGDNGFFTYQLQKGNNNSVSFGLFLCRVVKEAKNFIVPTFCSSDGQLQNTLEYLYQITHLFLPKYSPQLNPIELIWHQLKQHLLNARITEDTQICELIHKSIYMVHKKDIQKCIDHVYRIGLDLILKN